MMYVLLYIESGVELRNDILDPSQDSFTYVELVHFRIV